MTTDTKTNFRLSDSLTALAVKAVHLPVPLPTPSSVAEVKGQLVGTARELDLQAEQLATATRHTWDSVQHGRFQRVRSALSSHNLFSFDLMGPFTAVGAVAGAIAGFITGANTETMYGWAVFAAVAACGASVVPTLRIVDKLGARGEKRAKAAMVEESKLTRMVARFRKAEGTQKLQMAVGLDAVYASLDRQKLLSPEARATLLAVADDARALHVTHGDEARRMRSFAKLLREPLDAASAKSTQAVLAELSPGQRRATAEALLELVFADRKRVAGMDYNARNALHDMLTEEARGGPATATGPQKAA